MKKHFNFQLMPFIVLFSMIMVLTSCKKSEEPLPSVSLPTATTSTAKWISQTWAILNGTVNANNQITAVTFEYDTTTSYGQSINATPDTISGNISTVVSANLTGLTTSTVYYFRVKALSSGGTKYGNDLTFTTLGTDSVIIFNPNLTYDSVSDYDGNTYKTIQIGTQTWMAENLKTIRYNDGTAIPLVLDDTEWGALSSPGYSWYNNVLVAYGALYNWYTLSTGKLCPAGWHVPTDAEWTVLTTYLGGESVVGDKLKATGTTYWTTPNTGATNESGFTALPGGYRNYVGTFNSVRRNGYWWSSSESSSSDAYLRDLSYSYGNVDRSSSSKKGGFSVRCLKDN